eukprot:XP_020400295.1 wiskott-Aldrich syndrome protein family member 2-like [Zea mays]
MVITWGRPHLTALKRILCYLRGSLNYGLRAPRGGSPAPCRPASLPAAGPSPSRRQPPAAGIPPRRAARCTRPQHGSSSRSAPRRPAFSHAVGLPPASPVSVPLGPRQPTFSLPSVVTPLRRPRPPDRDLRPPYAGPGRVPLCALCVPTPPASPPPPPRPPCAGPGTAPSLSASLQSLAPGARRADLACPCVQEPPERAHASLQPSLGEGALGPRRPRQVTGPICRALYHRSPPSSSAALS